MYIFDMYIVNKAFEVLTKRSTLVDQNFRSYRGRSQLSVAIFMALRTHMGAQKLFIYKKN